MWRVSDERDRGESPGVGLEADETLGVRVRSGQRGEAREEGESAKGEGWDEQVSEKLTRRRGYITLRRLSWGTGNPTFRGG